MNNVNETRIQIDPPRPASREGVCRICLTGGQKEVLITPCRCRGSFAFAHSTCLSKWVEATGLPYCDVCSFPYLMDRNTKSFHEWRRIEGKQAEHQSAGQDCCFSFYNSIIAGILFDVSYGKFSLREREKRNKSLTRRDVTDHLSVIRFPFSL